MNNLLTLAMILSGMTASMLLWYYLVENRNGKPNERYWAFVSVHMDRGE